MTDSLVMRPGFRIGVVLGAIVSLASGLSVALLPTTPTWTLWKLTLAIDNRDTGEILDLVDIPRVASRTLDELAQGNTRTADGLDLAGMALELMAGARVRTVFDDPGHQVRITPGEFLDAWWSMEREGPEARMTLDAAGQPVELLLSEGPDLRWRIVGITPLAALLRVTPR